MKIYQFSSVAAAVLSLCLLSVANAEQGNSIKLVSSVIGQPSNISGVTEINGEEVIKLADYDEEMVIFDVRSEAKRKQGKIHYSEGFHLKRLTTRYLAEKVADKNTVIVFYGDKNSTSAAIGAKNTVAQGYKSVYWFKGGWTEWKRKGLKIDI